MFGRPEKLLFLLALIGSLTLSMGVAHAAVQDSDTDGLTDQAERDIYLTDPRNPDTDNDGIGDGEEVLNGTHPKQEDVSSAEMVRQATEGTDRQWYNRLFFDAKPTTLWIYSLSSLLVLVFTGSQIRSALKKKDSTDAIPVKNTATER